VDSLNNIVRNALSRRTFLAGAGSVAATTLVTGCGGNGPAVTITPPPPSGNSYTDADILNYALNLEYLEAEFYLRAATGSGLADSDTAPGSASNTTTGSVTAGSAGQVPNLTAAQQDILNEIAYEEQAHVKFLRSALGSAAVARPAIDLSFFGPLASAAGIANGSSFNPFASFDAFLIGAFVFEDVGVTAYAGAAGLISSAGVAAGYLTAAAGILAVEAYHAAYIRTALTARGIQMGASAYPYVSIANQVEALRATLTVGNSAAPGTSGSVETPLTIPTNVTTPSSIVAADPTNAIGFSRTINQVHHIVYGSPTVGAKSGGFFPNGTNSIFATTTA
jgi:hypothetical protein